MAPALKSCAAKYFSLYAAVGFSDHIAIDDCDTARFATAIIGTEGPASSMTLSTVTPGDDHRPDRPHDCIELLQKVSRSKARDLHPEWK